MKESQKPILSLNSEVVIKGEYFNVTQINVNGVTVESKRRKSKNRKVHYSLAEMTNFVEGVDFIIRGNNRFWERRCLITLKIVEFGIFI